MEIATAIKEGWVTCDFCISCTASHLIPIVQSVIVAYGVNDEKCRGPTEQVVNTANAFTVNVMSIDSQYTMKTSP